jgi:hypothetical protein
MNQKQDFSLGRATIKQICMFGLPGLMHFSQSQPLTLAIDATITELQLFIPEDEILNVNDLQIITTDGELLPPVTATMSSERIDRQEIAQALLSGGAISKYTTVPANGERGLTVYVSPGVIKVE